MVDITTFGAVGNDSDTSAAANSTAFDSALAAGAEDLFVPAGTYRLARQLNVYPSAAQHNKPCRIHGVDMYRSVLKPASTYTTVEPLALISCTYPTQKWERPCIEDLAIINANGNGLKIANPSARIRRVRVNSCKGGGIELGNTSCASIIEDCNIASNTSQPGTARDRHGIWFSGGTNGKCIIKDCTIIYHDSGIDIDSVVTAFIENCDVSGNNNGIKVYGSSSRCINMSNIFAELIYSGSRGIYMCQGLFHSIFGVWLDDKTGGNCRPLDWYQANNSVFVGRANYYGSVASGNSILGGTYIGA